MRRHALSFLVLGLLVVLALGSVDSKKSSPSSRPSSPSPAPSLSPPPAEPRQPTADETERMNRAMTKARAKLDTLVSMFGMSGEFVITDRAYVRDGRVTVDLDIDLVSQDAKSAFAARKLQNNTYPAFKRIYED